LQHLAVFLEAGHRRADAGCPRVAGLHQFLRLAGEGRRPPRADAPSPISEAVGQLARLHFQPFLDDLDAVEHGFGDLVELRRLLGQGIGDPPGLVGQGFRRLGQVGFLLAEQSLQRADPLAQGGGDDVHPFRRTFGGVGQNLRLILHRLGHPVGIALRQFAGTGERILLLAGFAAHRIGQGAQGLDRLGHRLDLPLQDRFQGRTGGAGFVGDRLQGAAFLRQFGGGGAGAFGGAVGGGAQLGDVATEDLHGVRRVGLDTGAGGGQILGMAQPRGAHRVRCCTARCEASFNSAAWARRESEIAFTRAS
jgi:hypothetical protein